MRETSEARDEMGAEIRRPRAGRPAQFPPKWHTNTMTHRGAHSKGRLEEGEQEERLRTSDENWRRRVERKRPTKGRRVGVD